MVSGSGFLIPTKNQQLRSGVPRHVAAKPAICIFCLRKVSPAGREIFTRCGPGELVCGEALMCGNFGFNPHPGRPPCVIQQQWYSGIRRMVAYLRRKLGLVPLKITRAPRDGRPRFSAR
jgi:hypothetical protein